MSKYLVQGTMMVPFPFETEVEASDAIEAESTAVREQRFILRDVHNLETDERPVNIVVQEIKNEEDK